MSAIVNNTASAQSGSRSTIMRAKGEEVVASTSIWDIVHRQKDKIKVGADYDELAWLQCIVGRRIRTPWIEHGASCSQGVKPKARIIPLDHLWIVSKGRWQKRVSG